MSDGSEWLLAVVLVYALAGSVKGLLGLGLPTLAVGLSAQFLDTRDAIALVICPMLAANAWQVMRSGEPGLLVARTVAGLWPLILSMLVFIGGVSLLAPSLPMPWVTGSLGAVITAFAVTSLWREPPPLPQRYDPAAQVTTGSLAGIIGGIAGIWAPPIVVYLAARRLEREEFVETVGVLLLAGCIVLLAGYLTSGLLTLDTALRSLLLIPPAILGYAIGERLRHRIPAARFRMLILAFFAVMGINLLRRALTGAA